LPASKAPPGAPQKPPRGGPGPARGALAAFLKKKARYAELSAACLRMHIDEMARSVYIYMYE